MRWTLAPTLILFGLSPFRLAGPPEKPNPPEAKPDAPAPEIHEIKPLPLKPIPDDPPPHEGAMIELPITVEPPDLIMVEVLELPRAGRSREIGWSDPTVRSAWDSMATSTSAV